MQHTVRTFAKAYDLELIIIRAFSFHSVLENETFPSLWYVPVVFNPRLQTTAGFARHSPRYEIELNPALAGPLASREQLVATFLHELAHLMEYRVLRTHGHGAGWWMMMHQLGQIPRRTHTIAACRKAEPVARHSLDDMGL